jgi:hypothetical protein
MRMLSQNLYRRDHMELLGIYGEIFKWLLKRKRGKMRTELI